MIQQRHGNGFRDANARAVDRRRAIAGSMGWVVILLTLSTLGAQAAHSEPKADWTRLFNGRDLTGWKHVGDGGMRVQNGILQTGGYGNGLLYWAGGKVGHCTIRVVYRTRGDYDRSGVFIRIPVEPRDVEMPTDYGYQVQIDNHPEHSYEDEYHLTGGLYSFTKPFAKAWKAAPEWNTLEITLDGPRTTVVLNGTKVSNYVEGQAVPARALDWEPQRGPRPEEGWLALKNEDGKKHTVYFKEVALKPLP